MIYLVKCDLRFKRRAQFPAVPEEDGMPMSPPSTVEGAPMLTEDDLKARGALAAERHKTSIDALLHPRHAGATPYRIVLGDVSRCSPLPPPIPLQRAFKFYT